MVVGIDLGTTNSSVSILKEGKSILIPNALGENLTPSVVSLSEKGEILIGRVALERLTSHPTRSFSNFKRTMGTSKKYAVDLLEFSSAELSSLILKSLLADAEKFLGEKVVDAIISVPAYFNNTQRQDTLFAARLAELNVRRLVNEPTAAALAYGMLEQEEGNTLVFDLGGGTCDISIIEKFEDLLEIHASVGNNFLGGTDFTNLIYNRLLQQLEQVHGFDSKSLSRKQQSILSQHAEKMKLTLSQKDTAVAEVNFNEKPLKLQLNYTEFENDTLPYQSKITSLIERALRDSELRVSQIDRIILVGGASRMPLIKKIIVRIFGKLPLCHINPDEVVCMGASYLGGILEKHPNFKDKIVTDVTPYSMGVSVLDEELKTDYFSPILDRNTTVPCSKKQIYHPIHPKQTKIQFEVYQGESRKLSENIKIGTLEVPIHKKPATEETFSVRFTYDSNGILEVTVTSLVTHKVYQSRMRPISSSDISNSFCLNTIRSDRQYLEF